MRADSRLVATLVTLFVLAPVSAGAQTKAQFVISGLSNLSEAGVSEEETAARGVSIPIVLTDKGSGTWLMEIAPADFQIPNTLDADHRVIKWALSSPAKGFLKIAEGLATCTIEVPLVATVEGEKEQAAFPLTFTTEHVDRLKGTQEPSPTDVKSDAGTRLEPQAGVVELVAAGVDSQGVDGGSPSSLFTSVRGQIVGLPTELKAEAAASAVTTELSAP